MPNVIERSNLTDDPNMGPLVIKFIRALPARVAALRSAERRSDWAQVATLAHQLAGASGGYGFPKIGQAAAILEAKIRMRHHYSEAIAQDLANSIDQFEAMCCRTVSANISETKH